MSFRWARAVTVCAAICASMAQALYAAQTEPTGRLALSQAIAAAEARNPDLAATGYELKASDAQITQARLRPNPEIGLDSQGIVASSGARAADEPQTTLTLSQVIELGGKRGRRIGVATAGREVVGVEQQARELDVLSEVTRRFIEVVSDQERVNVASEATGITLRTAQTVVNRVQAARSPQAELSRAQVAVTRAQLDEQQAQSILETARRELAAMWGATEARFDSAQADLYALPPLESFESLRARLERNPDFVRFASVGRLREAERRLALAQARPDLTLSVGVQRFVGTGDLNFGAGFSIGLPIFNRNQGAITEANVRIAQSGAEEHAVRIRAEALLYALYQQVQVSRQRLGTLQQSALPQAQAALDQTQAGYDRGRFSYLELASAQQDLLALRSSVIDAAADAHRLTAEIERLTSEPLSATPDKAPEQP